MADIVYKYAEMRQTASDIRTLATRYKDAGTTLNTDFTSAIANWEGESKDKMQKFISGTVTDYTTVTVPQLLTALADLLDANAEQMEKADHQIAENIPN